MWVAIFVILWLLIGVGVTYLYNQNEYVKPNKKNNAKAFMWFFGAIFWPIYLVQYFKK